MIFKFLNIGEDQIYLISRCRSRPHNWGFNIVHSVTWCNFNNVKFWGDVKKFTEINVYNINFLLILIAHKLNILLITLICTVKINVYNTNCRVTLNIPSCSFLGSPQSQPWGKIVFMASNLLVSITEVCFLKTCWRSGVNWDTSEKSLVFTAMQVIIIAFRAYVKPSSSFYWCTLLKHFSACSRNYV